MQFSTVIAASTFAASAAAAFTNGTVITTEVTVTEASTLTITEPCVIPSTFTAEQWTVTETRTCSECKAVPTGNGTHSVSSFEAAGARNVAGALAGVAAVAVALF